MVNRCSKCNHIFLESELQLSHDVPKYVGGLDSDGRHWVCKKCHDIYEKTVFAIMIKPLTNQIKREMSHRAKQFARTYFKEKTL